MASSRLDLFGTPALETAAGREPFAPERPYQLLAYLACRANWVARESAASLFWPDRDTASARANLRFVLVQVRRLPWVDGFDVRPDALRWVVDTDVRRFENAVATADWATAADASGEPLLDGFELDAPPPFVEWLRGERARLAALRRTALTARLAQIRDDPVASAALAARALAADPLDETALAAQLRALSAQGRTDDARRAYGAYARRLAAELAIEPSAALRDLARQLDRPRSAPDGPPAPVATSASPGFVGRRVELARLRELVTGGECRLLTIAGPGGVGKSTLARAALSSVTGAFPDGVFWVPLEELRAIEQVAPRCATAVGIAPGGADSHDAQLRRRLRAARALVVFDNAEHLAGFGAWLDALLADCAALVAVVTSRARLELSAEWLLPLDGLPAPDADETEADALRAFDAVRLFEARARRAKPDFDGRANAGEVAALVRVVEGLPLAIELAAAWVRVLPVPEIRAELEGSLDLLAAGGAATGRGVGVRDSFEHSWQLLAPAEQRALAGLAVFRGSFSRESARAVADAPLPLLAALADKSLLHATESGRFAFHPLIRQFALEKLAQAGDGAAGAARLRHAEHFLALLARFENFHAIDQRAALEAIGAEFPNVLAAWRFAVAERRIDLLEHCPSALESYLDARGQQQFGLELVTEAVAAIDANLPAHQLARCHLEISRAAFCYRRGEYPEGERAARSALQAARRAKYRFGIQSSTNTLGLTLWRLGRTAEAARCLRDVLRRARADRDEAAIPLYAVNLGRIELELGNHDDGERLVREALEGNRRNGNESGLQASLKELCEIELDHGRPDAMLAVADEGLAHSRASGFLRNVPYFECARAEARFELGELEASARHARTALDAVGAGGDRAVEPACRVRLAHVALRAGDLAGAQKELQAAARLAQAMRSPRVTLEVIVAYAAWCACRGDATTARRLFTLATAHPAATRRQRRHAEAALAGLPATSSSPDAGAGPMDVVAFEQALAPLLTASH